MKPPVVQQISWLSTLPQFAFLVSMFIVGRYISGNLNTGIVSGAVVYLLYSVGSRMWFARDHKPGISLISSGQYGQAIEAFQNSYDFFSRNPWIDDYRSVVLMSASAISYREMALCNIAFSYSQMGNGAKAEEFYRRTLSEFPDSRLAASAIRMIESSKSV